MSLDIGQKKLVHVGTVLAALQTVEDVFVVDVQCKALTTRNRLKSHFSYICNIYTSSWYSRVLSVSGDILVIILCSLIYSPHSIISHHHQPHPNPNEHIQMKGLTAKRSVESISRWNQCLALCGVKKCLTTADARNILVCQSKISATSHTSARRGTATRWQTTLGLSSEAQPLWGFSHFHPWKTNYPNLSVQGWLLSEHTIWNLAKNCRFREYEAQWC